MKNDAVALWTSLHVVFYVLEDYEQQLSSSSSGMLLIHKGMCALASALLMTLVHEPHDPYIICCNREDDPEPVKRLKREMAVALSEEDYVSAARIRDHPFMKLAVQIIQEKLAGRESEAEALQAELQKVVQAQQ